MLEVPGLDQIQIERCGLPLGDVDLRGRRVGQLIADRANPDGIFARFQPVLREAVLALGVADDGDGDGGPGALGADKHAFHRAFLGRVIRPVSADAVCGCAMRGGDIARPAKIARAEIDERKPRI